MIEEGEQRLESIESRFGIFRSRMIVGQRIVHHRRILALLTAVAGIGLGGYTYFSAPDMAREYEGSNSSFNEDPLDVNAKKMAMVADIKNHADELFVKSLFENPDFSPLKEVKEILRESGVVQNRAEVAELLDLLRTIETHAVDASEKDRIGRREFTSLYSLLENNPDILRQLFDYLDGNNNRADFLETGLNSCNNGFHHLSFFGKDSNLVFVLSFQLPS